VACARPTARERIDAAATVGAALDEAIEARNVSGGPHGLLVPAFALAGAIGLSAAALGARAAAWALRDGRGDRDGGARGHGLPHRDDRALAWPVPQCRARRALHRREPPPRRGPRAPARRARLPRPPRGGRRRAPAGGAGRVADARDPARGVRARDPARWPHGDAGPLALPRRRSPREAPLGDVARARRDRRRARRAALARGHAGGQLLAQDAELERRPHAGPRARGDRDLRVGAARARRARGPVRDARRRRPRGALALATALGARAGVPRRVDRPRRGDVAHRAPRAAIARRARGARLVRVGLARRRGAHRARDVPGRGDPRRRARSRSRAPTPTRPRGPRWCS
jgi:hypothetical protein